MLRFFQSGSDYMSQEILSEIKRSNEINIGVKEEITELRREIKNLAERQATAETKIENNLKDINAVGGKIHDFSTNCTENCRSVNKFREEYVAFKTKAESFNRMMLWGLAGIWTIVSGIVIGVGIAYLTQNL